MKFDGKRFAFVPSRDAMVTIWDITDAHMFSRACAMNLLRKTIKRIADDPYALWLGGGDQAEMIGIRDKRFDPETIDPSITVGDLAQLGKRMMEGVKKMFWPIRSKCLGLGKGNHEWAFEKYNTQSDLHGWLCTELKVRNLEYSAMFDLSFRQRLMGHADRVGDQGRHMQ